MKSFALLVALVASTVTSFTPRSTWTPRWSVSRVIRFSDEAGAEAAQVPVVAEEPSAVKEEVVLTLDTIEVGAEYAGTVKAVSDFGAFVNFGVEKQDGLVHKSQLSDDFVVDPSDIVSVGQKVSVRVLSVDIEQRKISLSMKSENAPAKQERSPRRSSNGPDLSKYSAMSREEEIEGKVRTLTSFGAFVEFPDGVNGLCHISQLSDQRTEQVSDAVSEGQTVKVRVIAVENGKLSLSMKTFDPEEPKERAPRRDGSGGENRRKGGKRGEEDVWACTTEPKWGEIQTDMNQPLVQYDNVLELKF